MDPKELNEEKLSLVRKYLREIIIVLSWVIIYFLYKAKEDSDEKVLTLVQEQYKNEQQKNRDLMEINRLGRDLEQQARTLNTQTDNRLSNQKSDK